MAVLDKLSGVAPEKWGQSTVFANIRNNCVLTSVFAQDMTMRFQRHLKL